MYRLRLVTFNEVSLAGGAAKGNYVETTGEDLLSLIMAAVPVWSEKTHLYYSDISEASDVTPVTEEEVLSLQGAEHGVYYVVEYPGELTTALIIGITVLATAIVLLAFMPTIPEVDADTGSSSNSLAGRSNKPRPNARIPDIYGKVRVIPELLTVPLTLFEDNVEKEISYMCVGRGSFLIEDVRDGDTPLYLIAGSSAEFYGPDSGPATGTPELAIGATITEPLYNVVRANDVNGQVLTPPNKGTVTGNNNIRFTDAGKIETTATYLDLSEGFDVGTVITIQGSAQTVAPGLLQITENCRFTLAGEVEFETYDPTSFVSAGDSITLVGTYFAAENDTGDGVTYVNLSGTYLVSSVSSSKITLSSPAASNADWTKLDSYTDDRTVYASNSLSTPVAGSSYDLDGQYTVAAVGSDSITLSSPASVNSNWNNLSALPGGVTPYGSATIYTTEEAWIGPVMINMPTAEKLAINIAAQSGLYKVYNNNGSKQPVRVTFRVGVTPVDSDGVATGPEVTQDYFVEGRWTAVTDPVNETLLYTLPSAGLYSVRLKRLTESITSGERPVVDKIAWHSLFGLEEVTEDTFGDITTVRTTSLATENAVAIKQRKLNCLVTRKLPERNVDDTFGPALVATENCADIICSMALDPKIGNRALAELNVPQIYETVADVATYFGITSPATFGGIFDESNISFEEMVKLVADSCFCKLYRQGSTFNLFFEKETSDSVLLFNHRNKVPGSEQRTVSFGSYNDHDGVEVTYTVQQTGLTDTIYIPSDKSAANAKKVKLRGPQTEEHAFLHAARLYNKIIYQNTSVSFSALAEASQLVLGQRVEVVNNVRDDVTDGDVLNQQGLTLSLSQPFIPEDGLTYYIHIQLPVGTVEVAEITAGSSPYEVILLSPLTETLDFSEENEMLPGYQIVSSTEAASSAFLLTEKGTYDNREVPLVVVNYDARYYQDDKTYS
jgi:hypothetical protein